MLRTSHGWRRTPRPAPAATDRLPNHRELLDTIELQAALIELLTDHRNRLAADLAELLCEGVAA